MANWTPGIGYASLLPHLFVFCLPLRSFGFDGLNIVFQIAIQRLPVINIVFKEHVAFLSALVFGLGSLRFGLASIAFSL
jgi:hypothetical protein